MSMRPWTYGFDSASELVSYCISNRVEGWLRFPDLWSCQKILMELIFNPCGEFRWSLEGPVSQMYSSHLHAGTPENFSGLLWSVLILKREWVQKAMASYRTYSSLVKLQHWFLSLRWKTCLEGRTAALVPGFPVKDLPLGRTLMMMSKYMKIVIHFYLP